MRHLIKTKLVGALMGLLLLAAMLPVSAQTSGSDSAAAFKAFIEKVQKAYTDARYLEFSVRYYYANADKPGLRLDSVSGEIQMDKGRSRMTLNGIETVFTDKYAIQVTREDRSIYVAAARHVTTASPVGMLDSVFAHVKGVNVSVKQEGKRQIMTLQLPPDQAYTQVVIEIDAKTGYLVRVLYSLNTAGLVEPEMLSHPGSSTPYLSKGQMEVLFGDYRKNAFDDGIFKDENYINRIAAGRFEPSIRYKDYHIYLASNNL